VLPSDADARTYVLAVNTADGQPLEPPVVQAIDAFVIGCKADGIWSAIKASCILMGARTLSGALTPLVGTAPTNNNFVSGDYNRKTGLLGNGSNKTIDTGLNHNTISQNSIHMAVYASTQPTTGAVRAYMGAGGFNAGATNFSRNSDNLSHRAQTGSAQAGIAGVAYSTGVSAFIGINRSTSADWTMRVNATNYTGGGVPWGNSQTPASGNIFVFDRIVAGGGANAYSDGRTAFFSAGDALTLSLLESRVNTLYTAIGAAIP
jgi:hypothetical protein